MKKFKSLREARLNAADYTVGSEKFPKGGFRALVTHKEKGTMLYLGSELFKSPKDAEGQAKAYLDGYAASSDRGANRASDDYAKKNKSKLMKEDVELDEAKIKPSDYTATSEKSKFGGHRAKVVHKTKGTTMYLGSDGFKTPKAAKAAADAYLTGYAISGDNGAQRMMQAHIKNNKKNLVDPSVLDTKESVDEAATKVIASVELWNGKKMKKSFKNQSAAEAFIKKMQDEEDVRGYNMYAEGLDEAGPTYIDGVKYQKEKKKKGFNKDDWEWNSSKQLYKKVDEAFLDSLREGLSIDESMDDTIKRLKKMGGVVYGDKLTSKSDKTPAKLASQSRGKKTVYFVVTDDGYTEYKDLGAVKKAWTIAGNNDDAKIALDLMSKQGDGDAIDMVLNKYKISIDKLDKIVKNNLGAKSAADFLGEAVALDEAFLRLPGEMINGELPMAIRDLESILRGLKAGNDFDAKGFNKQIARLNTIKKEAKKFNSEDEVPTRYQYTAKK